MDVDVEGPSHGRYAKGGHPLSVEQPIASAPQSGMTAGRIVLIIFGALSLVLGLAFAAGGGVIVFAQAAFRDAQGYFHSSFQPFSSSGYALTSQHIDLGSEPDRGGFQLGDVIELRLRVRSVTASPVFIGIGPAADVDNYVAQIEHDDVTDVSEHPFRVTYDHIPGGGPPDDPLQKQFWAVQRSGPGEQTVIWRPRAGDWKLVVMNADAGQPVDVRFQVGVKVRYLGAIAAGLLIAAVVFWIGGAFMLYFGVRRPRAPAAMVAT
jgi:hypothetical protein